MTVDSTDTTTRAAHSDSTTTSKRAFAVPDPSELLPPKDDPMTPEQLAHYDGTDPTRPVYVAVKGTVFDVSAKRDVYGRGGSYNIFAGRDASVALGKSSLKPEDASWEYGGGRLDAEELKVLEDWDVYFRRRYNIVGRVVRE